MASIIDLRNSSQAETHASCDVCVVGAGAAGLYLANRLCADGVRVVILEAGGAKCGSGASIGIESTFPRTEYGGATKGRSFGWGGTTSRWGGLLVPHSELDLGAEPDAESVAWRHIVDVVRIRSGAVFSTLKLRGHPDFFPPLEMPPADIRTQLRANGLETVTADFLPFRRRNFTYLIPRRQDSNPTIYLHAVASRWVAAESSDGLGALRSVEASTDNGRRLRVTATSFVIAAGAIESARILLEIDCLTGKRMLPRSAAVGRYLGDHLSCAIADVHSRDRARAAKFFGPRFVLGRMRTLRFTDIKSVPRSPRHFAHFIFDIDNAGFRLAKELLFNGQDGRSPSLRPSRLLNAVGGLSRLAYNRYVKSTLFIPAGTNAHLQLDIEQARHADNRVRLGDDVDRFGRPTSVVEWEIKGQDVGNISLVSQRLLLNWPQQSQQFPRLVRIDRGAAAPKPYDAYHPVGTCRMGADDEATVDLALRVRGTQNLYVLSTGVFPSAGTANPTFSMLCLGDMLGDTLRRVGKASDAIRLTPPADLVTFATLPRGAAADGLTDQSKRPAERW